MKESSPLRVCIVSEDLAPPFDEGKKKLVDNLVRALGPLCDVFGISVGSGTPRTPGVIGIPANKLFASRRLRAEMRAFQPHVVCYVPSSSLTFTSFLRSAMLRVLQPRAKLVVINVQPRPHGRLVRWLLRPLRPDMIFAQDEATLGELASLGCETKFLPSGVDLDRFVPVAAEKKRALRKKYGVPASKFTVLHAGHIKAGRNVGLFRELPEGFQGLVVGSTSMGQEGDVAQELREAGVAVINTYLKNVEEVYQMADCYLFPVRSSGNSIGVPLSVLEAMACNLPVVASPFGGLPLLFENGPGMTFAADSEQMLQGVRDAASLTSVYTRKMVESLSWSHVAERFLTEVRPLVAARNLDSGAPLADLMEERSR